jgi:gamma-glutamylcyclotransferase (GGCT)/AIG2-like uncharacterized protein YtfP
MAGSMNNKTNKLFVYGTLMGALPGASRAASIRGSLYHLGGYPGVKLDGKGTVLGQVYEIESDEQLQSLDRYEGTPNLYTREITTATYLDTLSDVVADTQEVMVYQYNHPVLDESLIDDGIWKGRRVNWR